MLWVVVFSSPTMKWCNSNIVDHGDHTNGCFNGNLTFMFVNLLSLPLSFIFPLRIPSNLCWETGFRTFYRTCKSFWTTAATKASIELWCIDQTTDWRLNASFLNVHSVMLRHDFITGLLPRESSKMLACKMPFFQIRGGSLTLPYLCSPQLWAFNMAATSITVESSGLAFCHVSAPSLPAQSVPNKCATGSRPSSFCPPQTMASVNSDFGMKLIAQAQNAPPFLHHHPTCLFNQFCLLS